MSATACFRMPLSVYVLRSLESGVGVGISSSSNAVASKSNGFALMMQWFGPVLWRFFHHICNWCTFFKAKWQASRWRHNLNFIILLNLNFIPDNISVLMYIMCFILCLFSALSHRVGALQIPIIIIISPQRVYSYLIECIVSGLY